MSILPGKLHKRLQRLFTRNTAIFLVCVLIAGIFWLLTKLSNQYTSDIQVPVVYSNLPDNKVVREKLPEQLTFYVNATGWDLLRHYLNLSSTAVIIDAQEFTEDGKMMTNSYKNVFTQQLQDKFEVQRVLPIEISFRFYDKRSQKLPVKLQADIKINSQYGLTDDIELTPDSVRVTGPAPYVDSLEAVYTDTLRLLDLTQNNRGTIGLQTLGEDTNIQYSEDEVEYHIPVAQFTEAVLEVPIRPVNNNQNTLLLTREVKVSFQVPVEQIKEYESEGLKKQFDVIADFQNVTPQDSLVPVTLANHPPAIRNVSIDPESVQFLYIKQ